LGKWLKRAVSVVLLTALGVAVGLYVQRRLQESQGPPMPPEFQEKLERRSDVAERVAALAATRAMLKSDAEEGVRRLRALIAEAPASPEASEARLILAELLAEQGKTSEALALLEPVVADPQAGARGSRALLLRAIIRGAADPATTPGAGPAAARKELAAILADDAHPPAIQNRARLELGLLESKAGDFLRAIATLTPLTQRNFPEKAAAYDAIRQAIVGQARRLVEAGDPDAVIAFGEDMLKKFPDLAALRGDIQFHQAAALRQLGRLAEARVAVERLRRLPEAAQGAGRSAELAAELDRINRAEDATAATRSRAAFLKAKAEGKDGRASFEGDIAADTTWAKAQSPLVLTGKVTVAQGATLTIEAGCVVQFVLGARLVVQGALVAVGTEAEPVRFTSAESKTPTPFDGEGIFLADSSADERCRIEGVVVEYQRVGIALAAASPTLRRCLLTRNGNAGLLATDGAEPRLEDLCRIEANDGTGLRAEGASPIVRRCLILNNGGDGVALAEKAKGSVEACRIRGNRGAGIACDGFASPTIQGNEVAGNQGDGIRCNRFSQVVIQGNVIRENHGTGIRCTLDSPATITGNLIEANRDYPLTIERSDGVIKGNNILGNRPYGLNLVRSASPQIEGNWIEGNGGCGIILGEGSAPLIIANAILGQKKAINNATNLTIQAKENYFGEVSDATVDQLILDKGEERTLGEVVWRPRLSAPPPRPPRPTLDLPPMP